MQPFYINVPCFTVFSEYKLNVIAAPILISRRSRQRCLGKVLHATSDSDLIEGFAITTSVASDIDLSLFLYIIGIRKLGGTVMASRIAYTTRLLNCLVEGCTKSRGLPN